MSQPAIIIILNTFNIIRKAELRSVAESKAEIGDGDCACASGNQKWTGAKPIFVPIPNSMNTKDSFNQSGSKF